MAKNLKLTIKNTQIAKAIDLSGLKSKLGKKKEAPEAEEKSAEKAAPQHIPTEEVHDDSLSKEEAPRIKARSKSAFAEKPHPSIEATPSSIVALTPPAEEAEPEEAAPILPVLRHKEPEPVKERHVSSFDKLFIEPDVSKLPESPVIEAPPKPKPEPVQTVAEQPEQKTEQRPQQKPSPAAFKPYEHIQPKAQPAPVPYVKLGPTGQHIKDLLPAKYGPKPTKDAPTAAAGRPQVKTDEGARDAAAKLKQKVKGVDDVVQATDEDKNGKKSVKFKEFRDIKPAVKKPESTRFDVRDRQGLRASEDDSGHFRKRKHKQMRHQQEDTTIRPSTLSVRVPITIKDLAAEMKLKTAQLIGKLFLSGVVMTINDFLEDPTAIQLLGHEFGCNITIDTSEEKRIRITDKTIDEEIESSNTTELVTRAPVVAFMGHVDHGKTSLIDAIRKSNRAAGEAGAITQHIGAFRCKTAVGDITILDTPGHEAFAAMRERGANVTDIVVLVVAGDEGMKTQTVEAMRHAKTAGVTIVVAINKCDKPNFNVENVYRQLAEQELLPEAWGGSTITVNCSAVTGEGIDTLLEMLALQAEVLELRANPKDRARGTVLESEMHKGLGAVSTVLIQNGTIRKGDTLVCDNFWGRVKTMHDEFGRELLEAGPSTPVEITGISGLPDAGQELIVVKNEKEAKDIAEARAQGQKQKNLQLLKKSSVESIFQLASEGVSKKIFNVVLRTDVQGSLEALKTTLSKIYSNKIELNLISAGVGEISESDVQLAAASKATIIGFHTQVESHAESLIKQLGVQVRLHDIIYHVVDDVKAIMVSLLDKIAIETERGKAEVRATFKSSQHGLICGCMIIEGSVTRNNLVRIIRNKEQVWKGTISSLKRVKEDVREVLKGFECGILLNNYNDTQVDDIIEAFEITYITQEL